jgi:hypothetical protein
MMRLGEIGGPLWRSLRLAGKDYKGGPYMYLWITVLRAGLFHERSWLESGQRLLQVFAEVVRADQIDDARPA